MKTQFLLIGILVFLIGFIVSLGVLLFLPKQAEEKIDFPKVIEMTYTLMDSVKAINITYGVNLSLNGVDVLGEVYFYKNGSNFRYEVTPSLMNYEGYGLTINPERIIRFIQVNNKANYAGELEMNGSSCWSTITEPVNNDYKKFDDNSDYVFVTCFDKRFGYPLFAYNAEVTSDQTYFANIFIENVTYSL